MIFVEICSYPWPPFFGHRKNVKGAPFIQFFMSFKIRSHTIGVDLKFSICPQQPLFCDLVCGGGGGEQKPLLCQTLIQIILLKFAKTCLTTLRLCRLRVVDLLTHSPAHANRHCLNNYIGFRLRFRNINEALIIITVPGLIYITDEVT